MGQYYKVALKIGSENTGIYENDNCRKLTEFSWVGNRFSDFIASRLFKNKGRVAWVGDYSDDDETMDNIGIWAWHELEIIDYKPTWREVEFKFIERA